VPEFSAATAWQTLSKACEHVSLDPDGAELLRFGENAIFRLARNPVVVRIARSARRIDDVRKEVRVARWLRSADYPAARLADVGAVDQPMVIGEHPVTFWEYIETAGPSPTSAELGALLRRLHDLSVPESVDLPKFRPFARVAGRLAAPKPGINPSDVAYLRNRFDDLRARYATLEFPFSAGAVHGDAHPGNLMRTTNNRVVLIDFEAFSYGPREWDLSLAAAYRHAFDWFTDDDYRAFVEAYGYDVSSWAGYETLREIRELGMVTWLMQLVDEPGAAVEFYPPHPGHALRPDTAALASLLTSRAGCGRQGGLGPLDELGHRPVLRVRVEPAHEVVDISNAPA
jgi:Ser/Thr protein kinase RdoA (MazF antagonist)